VITVVGASIGSPSTPGVGIIILATILQGMGIPAAGVAILLGVDRILDMCRTAVNVTGDLTACVVMNRWLEDVKEDPLTAPAPTDQRAS
jgi:Na+/H+-dicarboxylate symporter